MFILGGVWMDECRLLLEVPGWLLFAPGERTAMHQMVRSLRTHVGRTHRRSGTALVPFGKHVVNVDEPHFTGGNTHKILPLWIASLLGQSTHNFLRDSKGDEVWPQAGQQSAPHMHVLVCICSNVRQFH